MKRGEGKREDQAETIKVSGAHAKSLGPRMAFERFYVQGRDSCDLLRRVLHVGSGDGVVEPLGKSVGVSRRKAGSRDRLADNDQERAGVQRINVNGEELIGSDQGERNQGHLGLDGHIGAARHHRLKLPVGSTTALWKEHKRKAVFESSDAAVKTGDERTWAFGVDRHLAGTVEVPPDKGSLPERLFGENAELEGEIGEQDRGVHVAEVVGGVDGGFVYVEFFAADNLDRRHADQQQRARPEVRDHVLLAAGPVPETANK